MRAATKVVYAEIGSALTAGNPQKQEAPPKAVVFNPALMPSIISLTRLHSSVTAMNRLSSVLKDAMGSGLHMVQ